MSNINFSLQTRKYRFHSEVAFSWKSQFKFLQYFSRLHAYFQGTLMWLILFRQKCIRQLLSCLQRKLAHVVRGSIRKKIGTRKRGVKTEVFDQETRAEPNQARILLIDPAKVGFRGETGSAKIRITHENGQKKRPQKHIPLAPKG